MHDSPNRPGVDGVIASVNGDSLTATTTTGTSSNVTWTASTKISNQDPTTINAVKVGACVSVRPAGAFGGGRVGLRPTGSATRSPRPTGTFTIPSKLSTSAVTIEPAATCTAPLPTPTSSASASSRAARGRSGFGGRAGFAGGGFSGIVKSTGSNTFMFATRATSKAASRSVTVTTTTSTTYTQDQVATKTAVKAGLCVAAQGTMTGTTLAAKSLVISQSVNGACQSGFGGRNGGGAGA